MKVLVISAIVLVAVVMGMSSVAPAIAPPPVTPNPPGVSTQTQDACDHLEEILDRLIDLGIRDQVDKAAALAAAGC